MCRPGKTNEPPRRKPRLLRFFRHQEYPLKGRCLLDRIVTRKPSCHQSPWTRQYRQTCASCAKHANPGLRDSRCPRFHIYCVDMALRESWRKTLEMLGDLRRWSVTVATTRKCQVCGKRSRHGEWTATPIGQPGERLARITCPACGCFYDQYQGGTTVPAEDSPHPRRASAYIGTLALLPRW